MKHQIFYGNAIALNYSVNADGSPLTVQLSPFGEFVLHDGGKNHGMVQHCSREAFEAMVANWKAAGSPDILVDVDHHSATGGSTQAAAWAKNLRVEESGLCADFAECAGTDPGNSKPKNQFQFTPLLRGATTP